MTWTSVIVITLLALVSATTHAQQPGGETPAWAAVVDALQPGAFVEIRLKDGRTLRGTVLERGVDTVLVKPRTRVPVPKVEVAFRDIDSVRKPGMSTGKKVSIGVVIFVLAALSAATRFIE